MISYNITKRLIYFYFIIPIFTFYHIFFRKVFLKRILRENRKIKIYYGCGDISQKDYINIDIRFTKATDILGDLSWCKRNLTGICEEVYLSHVLEHYCYPGKEMRCQKGTVPYALRCIYEMLIPGGYARIAVPDFYQLSLLYHNKELALFPRISGRLCGEQDYNENLHKCVFDKDFLEKCLVEAGFIRIRHWKPEDLDLIKDGSFDSLNGHSTSLNLLAEKPL